MFLVLGKEWKDMLIIRRDIELRFCEEADNWLKAWRMSMIWKGGQGRQTVSQTKERIHCRYISMTLFTMLKPYQWPGEVGTWQASGNRHKRVWRGLRSYGHTRWEIVAGIIPGRLRRTHFGATLVGDWNEIMECKLQRHPLNLEARSRLAKDTTVELFFWLYHKVQDWQEKCHSR